MTGEKFKKNIEKTLRDSVMGSILKILNKS